MFVLRHKLENQMQMSSKTVQQTMQSGHCFPFGLTCKPQKCTCQCVTASKAPYGVRPRSSKVRESFPRFVP